MKNVRIKLLTAFIGWDFSLHFVELFNLTKFHPLYPYFPTTLFYNIFWSVSWGIALVIAISLIEGGIK